MSALTFTPGKFYKTRDGRKYKSHEVGVTFFSTKEDGMIGVRYEDDGTVSSISHHLDGSWLKGKSHPYDLIAEWKDAPEVDWSKMPAWANWVSKDAHGGWWWYSDVPGVGYSSWMTSGVIFGRLPAAYCPKWSGDWRDSLVTRTEGGK